MNEATYAARRDKLREKIARQGLKAMIVSHAANRFYLSGFELHDPQCNESAGMLIITADGPDWLLTDPRYLDAAKRLWPEAYIHIYKHPKHDDIRNFIKGIDIDEIGFEPTGLCYKAWSELRDGLHLRPVQNLVEDLRLIKDATEIEIMRRSNALNTKAFEFVQQALIPGRTELEVAWEVEKFFRENGASELAFPSIVGVGPNAALPHAIPGETTIRENELVLVDMGCRLDEYNSDMTRTFWVGDTPSDRFTSVVSKVREAQDAAIALIKPGVKIADLYHAARAVFEKYGDADYFTHALGHGIGLETHEAPSVGPHAAGTLQPGMVITIEPGLYWADWGGVRWEYMVHVTEDGAEIL